jgi:Na+-translocating ferredoxin:NAD+ oxidoreductase subunit C
MFGLNASTEVLPCIRCGDCIPVCPVRLQPQALLLAVTTDNWQVAEDLSLHRCNECGACDAACPSRIPLSQLFKFGKIQSTAQQEEQSKRNAARLRFEKRAVRLQRLADENEKRHDQRKQNVASADGVAQALARAKAKREQGKSDKT